MAFGDGRLLMAREAKGAHGFAGVEPGANPVEDCHRGTRFLVADVGDATDSVVNTVGGGEVGEGRVRCR